MKNLKVFLLLIVIMSAFSATVSAQKKNKKVNKDSLQAAAITKLITSKKYTFTAEYAANSQGSMVPLNTYYYLEINPDALTSVLPFYGNTYSSGGTKDSGIRISSKNFGYEAVKNALGHWYVSIKPQDSTTEKEIVLDIANDGAANLVVLSVTRGRMTFMGTVEEGK